MHFPKQINLMITSKNNGLVPIYAQIPRIKQPIPLFVLFRALGVVSDDICGTILLDINNKNYKKQLFALQASIVAASKTLTQEDAIHHITQFTMFTPINLSKEEEQKSRIHQNILDNDLFRIVAQKNKYFLGYMANQIIRRVLDYVSRMIRFIYQ